MKGRALAIAVVAALVWIGARSAGGQDRAAAHPVVGAEAPHPVVVELFTAQGCSSCPPADRLLAQLGAASGGAVVPLEFHVEYWNQGGWTDPFSSAEWTRRQAAYAKHFGATQLYTPQAVVNGTSEMIGSREAEVRAAIAAAAAKPAASIALSLEPSAKDVRVAAKTELPEALRGRKWDLMLAVYETGLVTPVARGENGGKSLANEYVVRSLRRAGGVDASGALEAKLPLDKDWNRARVGVAAFLQDPGTLEIRGAAASPLPTH